MTYTEHRDFSKGQDFFFDLLWGIQALNKLLLWQSECTQITKGSLLIQSIKMDHKIFAESQVITKSIIILFIL